MLITLLEVSIFSLIFGTILFIIVFTIKCSECKTAEEKSEVASHQKNLYIKCFVIVFAFFIIVPNLPSGSSYNRTTYTPKHHSSSSSSSSSSYSSYSSSSSNSYDDGYDDYYENGDYDQDRYDNDESYRDGVDDAMDDEY